MKRKTSFYLALVLSLVLIAGTVSGCGKLAQTSIGQFVAANQLAVAAGAAVIGGLALASSNSGGTATTTTTTTTTSTSTTTTTTTTSTTTSTLPYFVITGTVIRNDLPTLDAYNATVFLSPVWGEESIDSAVVSFEVTFEGTATSFEYELHLNRSLAGSYWLAEFNNELSGGATPYLGVYGWGGVFEDIYTVSSIEVSADQSDMDITIYELDV